MSNGFDYFGNALPSAPAQRPAVGGAGYASVHAFAPPATAPQYGLPSNPTAPDPYAPNRFGGAASDLPPSAPTTRARVSRRPLIALAVVVIAAAVAAGIAINHRAHTIALPPALAGLSKADLHSVASDVKSTKQKLSQSGIHDVSVGLYGGDAAGSDQALAVIAGHPASQAPDFSQLASALATTQIAGVSITPSVVTSGSSTFQCQTIAAEGRSVGLCEWQTPTTILFAVGEGVTTNDIAAALDDVIGADQLS